MKRGQLRGMGIVGVAAMLAGLPGCIIVASKDSDYGRIEEKKAEAQYLTARAELERINLERQKAGLAPIDIPSHPAFAPCDNDPPSEHPE